MAWMRAPLLLALCLGGSHGRTLQEVNLVPEAEAADLKKQEEAQREKALAEAAAAEGRHARRGREGAAVLGALPDHTQFSVPDFWSVPA